MPLIPSHRHRPADLTLWVELEAADQLHGRTAAAARRHAQATRAAAEFNKSGNCYASVSWGKDSLVLAHIVRLAAPTVPLIWVRVEPIANPDCMAVRDAFLRMFPGPYEEIVVQCRRDRAGWHATGTLEAGFAKAVQRFGGRYLNGVRAEEAGYRKIMMRKLGLAGPNTCRPLGWWTAAEIYGHLAVHDLPVHPAYAMLGGGRWDRNHLRVSSLGGRRGDGMGRNEWELEYYGDVLRRLEAGRV